MSEVSFSCTCGKLCGHLDVASPNMGNHLSCHCPDCRAAAIHLGQPDPAPDGVEIWQTTPDNLHITSGGEHLAALQLSPKGLYRWYADCCNAPLFSTPTQTACGHSLNDRQTDQRYCPARPTNRLGVQKKDPSGKYRHKGISRIAFRMIRMALGANLSGQWRKTPCFDATGAASSAQLCSRAKNAAPPRPETPILPSPPLIQRQSGTTSSAATATPRAGSSKIPQSARNPPRPHRSATRPPPAATPAGYACGSRSAPAEASVCCL